MEPFNYGHFSAIAESNRRRLEAAYRFEEPDRVPVIIGLGGPYYAKIFGYTLKDYYGDLRIMLDVQIKGIKWRLLWLRDDLPRIGLWLDIGSTAEGVVFGCPVEMPCDENPWRSPWIVPCIRSLEDIDRLEVPDPYDHPGIRGYYERLEEYRELARRRYGDIPVSGRLQIHPPLSAAGSLLGPQKLYTWLYKYPREMGKLLKKLEETFKVLQEYYYSVTGAERGSIGLADDHAGYLNRSLYERFVIPYNLELYESFGDRHRSLHMDSPMHHIADIVTGVYRVSDVDVGVENDIGKLSPLFRGKAVFRGNADWRVLMGGSLRRVELEVERCIFHAAPGGGYIFDNGGETYVGVPPDVLRYEVEYAKRVGRYPIRRENFRHLDAVLRPEKEQPIE